MHYADALRQLAFYALRVLRLSVYCGSPRDLLRAIRTMRAPIAASFSAAAPPIHEVAGYHTRLSLHEIPPGGADTGRGIETALLSITPWLPCPCAGSWWGSATDSEAVPLAKCNFGME